MANAFGLGDMASMGIPGANPTHGAGLLETLELVRKAWTSFALPPGLSPTLDPAEIARRVAELKSIEQWLAMNLTMLRGTIQAFEIQQSTLSTLRSIGESSAAAVSAAAAAAQSGFPPGPPDEAGVGASEEAKAADTGGKSRRKQSESAGAAAAPGDEAGTATPEAVPFPAFGTGMDPVAWWDLLQKQFGQVANAAMASIPMPGQVGGQPTRAAQPAAEGQPAGQPGARSGDTPTAGAAQTAGSKASDAGAGDSGKTKARAAGSAGTGTGTGASGARRRSTRSG